MALSVKTGSFTKSASTGAQSVVGVGFTPKVLIFWTNYKSTTDTLGNDANFAWGMTTGAAESYSTSFATQYGVATSNRSKRAAAKAITIIQYGESLLAEADLTSFDADGFTLNWSTNSGGTQIIHYLALGGSDITGQKVLTLTSPTLTGNKSYTGVGFKPDSLILAGPSSTSALPFSTTASDLKLSFIAGGGSVSSLNVGGPDASGVSDTYRVIKTASSTIRTNTSFTTSEESTFVSMDTDGFTLNYSTAGTADIFGCLALKGVRNKVGSFTSTGTITGVGFAPNAVLFSSTQRANTNITGNAQLVVGATTGASENQSVALVDDSHDSGLGETTDAAGVDSTTRCLTRLTTGPTALSFYATLASFDSDGYTLTWTPSVVGDIITYLALGSAPTIQTDAATVVTTTTAQLNGTVNPKGSSASYYFEWGLTTSYGNTTATQGPTSGSSDLPYSQAIAGLIGNTVYHYRAVVSATGTVIYGSDQTFETPGVDRAVMVF